jgi:hypothetical protein
MFEIPRYLIAKKTLLGGQRGDKLVLLPKPVVHAPAVQVGYGRGRGMNIIRTRATSDSLIPVDSSLEFENWEYRFWTLEMHGTIGSAVCRNCEVSLRDKEMRRKHLNKNGCADRIVNAYALLLKDRKCVVCDTLTTNKKWGVPLCLSTSCMLNFMHQEAVPAALCQALAIGVSRGIQS